MSTAGSIVGTFLAGFVLFSWLGHRTVLFVTAGALAVCAWITAERKRARLATAVLLLLVFSASQGLSRLEAYAKQPIRLDTDTRYNRVWITDAFYGKNAEPAIIFQVNDAFDSGVSRVSKQLLFEYMRFFAKFRSIHPQAKRFLVVGSGCGTLTQHLLEESPDNKVDAVELDPELTALGRQVFGFKEDARLRVFHEDARTFVRQSKDAYDVIFVDVFHSLTIPFHLATAEAVRELSERVAPGGIVLVNVIAAAEGPREKLFRAMVSTYRTAFPQVRAFAMRDPEAGDVLQNFILLASKEKEPRKFDPRKPEEFDLLMKEWSRPVPDAPALRDDFAPVEHYTSAFLSERGSARGPVTERVRILLEDLSERLTLARAERKKS